MTGVIESLEARIRVLEDRVSLLEGRGQPPRPGELCAPVVFIDSLGAARTRPEDCRDGVSYIHHAGRTYWPLSDQDNRRLLQACCGHGEFDGPQVPGGHSDARLLAAAPELLEALQNLLAVRRGDGATKPNADALAESAVAKALGHDA